MVYDEALDQSLYELDPLAIADADGNIIAEGDFGGTSRIRWKQIPWEPGTSDEGWTGPDDTRICRLQSRLPFLPYSPIYQLVIGERARGPYEVSWESIIAKEGHLLLDIDLTNAEQEPVSSETVYFPCPLSEEDMITAETAPLIAHSENAYVDISTTATNFGLTRVEVMPDGHDENVIMTIPAATNLDDIESVDLYAEVDVQTGDQFRVAVETSPLAFCQLVVHGASPA
jgi:hypothetical protein